MRFLVTRDYSLVRRSKDGLMMALLLLPFIACVAIFALVSANGDVIEDFLQSGFRLNKLNYSDLQTQKVSIISLIVCLLPLKLYPALECWLEPFVDWTAGEYKVAKTINFQVGDKVVFKDESKTNFPGRHAKTYLIKDISSKLNEDGIPDSILLVKESDRYDTLEVFNYEFELLLVDSKELA